MDDAWRLIDWYDNDWEAMNMSGCYSCLFSERVQHSTAYIYLMALIYTPVRDGCLDRPRKRDEKEPREE